MDPTGASTKEDRQISNYQFPHQFLPPHSSALVYPPQLPPQSQFQNDVLSNDFHNGVVNNVHVPVPTLSPQYLYMQPPPSQSNDELAISQSQQSTIIAATKLRYVQNKPSDSVYFLTDSENVNLRVNNEPQHASGYTFNEDVRNDDNFDHPLYHTPANENENIYNNVDKFIYSGGVHHYTTQGINMPTLAIPQSMENGVVNLSNKHPMVPQPIMSSLTQMAAPNNQPEPMMGENFHHISSQPSVIRHTGDITRNSAIENSSASDYHSTVKTENINDDNNITAFQIQTLPRASPVNKGKIPRTITVGERVMHVSQNQSNNLCRLEEQSYPQQCLSMNSILTNPSHPYAMNQIGNEAVTQDWATINENQGILNNDLHTLSVQSSSGQSHYDSNLQSKLLINHSIALNDQFSRQFQVNCTSESDAGFDGNYTSPVEHLHTLSNSAADLVLDGTSPGRGRKAKGSRGPRNSSTGRGRGRGKAIVSGVSAPESGPTENAIEPAFTFQPDGTATAVLETQQHPKPGRGRGGRTRGRGRKSQTGNAFDAALPSMQTAMLQLGNCPSQLHQTSDVPSGQLFGQNFAVENFCNNTSSASVEKAKAKGEKVKRQQSPKKKQEEQKRHDEMLVKMEVDADNDGSVSINSVDAKVDAKPTSPDIITGCPNSRGRGGGRRGRGSSRKTVKNESSDKPIQKRSYKRKNQPSFEAESSNISTNFLNIAKTISLSANTHQRSETMKEVHYQSASSSQSGASIVDPISAPVGQVTSIKTLITPQSPQPSAAVVEQAMQSPATYNMAMSFPNEYNQQVILNDFTKQDGANLSSDFLSAPPESCSGLSKQSNPLGCDTLQNSLNTMEQCNFETFSAENVARHKHPGEGNANCFAVENSDVKVNVDEFSFSSVSSKRKQSNGTKGKRGSAKSKKSDLITPEEFDENQEDMQRTTRSRKTRRLTSSCSGSNDSNSNTQFFDATPEDEDKEVGLELKELKPALFQEHLPDVKVSEKEMETVEMDVDENYESAGGEGRNLKKNVKKRNSLQRPISQSLKKPKAPMRESLLPNHKPGVGKRGRGKKTLEKKLDFDQPEEAEVTAINHSSRIKTGSKYTVPVYSQNEKDALYDDQQFVIDVNDVEKAPDQIFIWQILKNEGCLRQYYPSKYGERQFFISSPVKWYFFEEEFKSEAFYTRFQPIVVVIADTQTKGTPDPKRPNVSIAEYVVQYLYVDKPFFSRMSKYIGKIHLTQKLRGFFIESLPVLVMLTLHPTFLKIHRARIVGDERISLDLDTMHQKMLEGWKCIGKFLENVVQDAYRPGFLNTETVEQLKQYPSLTYGSTNVDKGAYCSACLPMKRVPIVTVSFAPKMEGLEKPYDLETLQEFTDGTGPQFPQKPIFWCRPCSKRAKTLHRLLHFRYNLWRVTKQNILKDIELFRRLNTPITDECLLWSQNNEIGWMNLMFLELQLCVAEVNEEFLDKYEVDESSKANVMTDKLNP